jgi:hypothetical protein
LHVEKHGLQFHETSLAFYRDGQFYLAQNNRRLFQYSFQTSLARGVLTKDYFGLLNGLANSPPEFRGSDISSYVPPIPGTRTAGLSLFREEPGESPSTKTHRSCQSKSLAYSTRHRSCRRNGRNRKLRETFALVSATTPLISGQVPISSLLKNTDRLQL